MKREDRKAWFNGFKSAFPVFVSYLTVGLAVGIAARNAGLSAFQAGLMSFLNQTSAGEVAGIEIIKEGGSYFEIVLSQIAINLRYLLMSAALTIKLQGNESIASRMLMALGITDEDFGIAVVQKDPLSPYFSFGCFCMSMPGWAIGTYIGATLGNVLPANLVSALSIGLYGMFIAIVITPAKQNPVVGFLALISMVLSFCFEKFIPSVSFGMRVIILSVGIGLAAAWLFPVEDQNG